MSVKVNKSCKRLQHGRRYCAMFESGAYNGGAGYWFDTENTMCSYLPRLLWIELEARYFSSVPGE